MSMLQGLKTAVRKSFHLIGFDIHRYYKQSDDQESSDAEVNQVMPDVASLPGLHRLIASRLPAKSHVILLGSVTDIDLYQSIFSSAAKITSIKWDWDQAVDLAKDCLIIICSIPLSSVHWNAIQALKKKYGPNIVGIQELVLPFSPILFLQGRIGYHSKTIDEIALLYLGQQQMEPIDRLNEIVPLKDKRVIEFGPFDGGQTAGLVHHGVRELVCIEARADNFVKTLNAKEIFGWSNVRLVMDDMHNADSIRYGKFDLAFCHGAYYHAVAPFVLLENLVSLSNNVFVGGFVLKDNALSQLVEYQGCRYRAQMYIEQRNCSAGVNATAYYFHPEDLTRFFSERGYRITIMDDEPSEWGSNRYLRFVARR